LPRTVEEYHHLIRLNPRSAQLRFELGVVYKELGKWRESLTEWQKVIEIDSNHLPARQAIQDVLKEYGAEKHG
jgi:tetratricopeptide (TPR) repeat protein